MDLAYTSDVWSVASGGARSGSAHLSNVDLKAYANLEHYFGLHRTIIEVHAFYNDGGAFSGSYVGDAQGISNIETGTRLLRMHQAWIEHTAALGGWSIRSGLMDVNSEFDSLETSGVFLASAHGMGTDIAQSGSNGPSTFPSTSVGIRIAFAVGKSSTLRSAIMDAVPNDPDDPQRSAVRISSREGLFVISEIDHSSERFRLLAGGWMYSRKQEDMILDDTDSTPRRSAGWYVRGEMPDGGDADGNPRGFFRMGTAASRANTFDRFASMGIAWTGMVPARPEDETGLAFIWARTGRPYRQSLLRNGINPPDAEAGLELTHRFSVAGWLAVQPCIQYVISPVASEEAKNALVVGLRIAFNRSF